MRLATDQTTLSVDGSTLSYDLFMPAGSSVVPAVILIHGGGWISGDRTEMHPIAERFAENGFCACCAEYRLAPLHHYPTQVEDCQRLVAHLRANADSIGIHPDQLAAFGNSAGGYLATMLAVKDLPGEVSSRVNAAINICGLTDLTNPQQQHPMISWDFIQQFLGRKYSENSPKWVDASPVYHVDEHAAPILIFHGDEDDIVWIDQSRKLYESYVAAGASARLEILASEGHSFTLSAFERILSESFEFLSEQFST